MSESSNTDDVGTREEPWRDKELMFRLHFEDDYTYREMANRFGCTPSTVGNWMKKHRAQELRVKLDVDIPDSYPYRDPELMERLYVEEELSSNEIAAVLDCSSGAVMDWLDRHGINTRSASEGISKANKKEGPHFWTKKQNSYEYIKDGKTSFLHHRLLAVAYYGYEAVCGNVVHHIDEIEWHNVESNLELMELGDHTVHHKTAMNWLDKLRAAEMYRSGASSYDIAPTFDVSAGTVIKAVRDVDPQLIRNQEVTT